MTNSPNLPLENLSDTLSELQQLNFDLVRTDAFLLPEALRRAIAQAVRYHDMLKKSLEYCEQRHTA